MTYVIPRVIGYSVLLGVTLLMSHYWFEGSDVALLSLFVLGGFVAEMVIPACLREFHPRAKHIFGFEDGMPNDGKPSVGLLRAFLYRRTAPRAILYVVAVFGLAISGFYLVSKAMEVRRCNRAQEAIEHRLTSAMNDTTNMVALATNDNHLVVAISGGLLKKVGYTREEILNKPVTNIIPGFDLNQARADVSIIRGSGHDGWMIRENRKMNFRTKNGGDIIVEMTVIACRLSTDRIVERDVLFMMLSEEAR